MKIPKRFKKLTAWYYRNFKYNDQIFTIEFDNYKPALFEYLHSYKGLTMIYLGNSKYIEIPKRKLTINTSNIQNIEL